MSANAEIQTPEVANKPTENEQNEVASLVENANNEDRAKNGNQSTSQLENDLKQKDAILATFKIRIDQLEKEVSEEQKFKAQHLKEAEDVAILKAKYKDTLTKAKDIIFEKIQVIKNQELQIEALNQQIDSLKEVVTITKDLQEIRNMEIEQLETKIQCMNDRYKAEKMRYDLRHKKLETMLNDLKRDYETQQSLLSTLRERYNERELARGVLLDDANSANASISDSTSANASTSINGEASSIQVNGEQHSEKD